MEYLHKFESESAFDAAYSGTSYLEPWVSATLCPETQSFSAKLNHDGNVYSGVYNFVLIDVVDHIAFEAV